MTASYQPGLHRFAVFVFAWTILLLIAGALVTSNDAALSVTDWPTSHGRLVPHLDQLHGGDRFEFSHRAIAGGLGILLIIEAVWIWLKEDRRWLRWFALVSVGGVVAQAILGGQVVIRLLHYWLPVLHACFAQIMFAAILSMAVFTSKWWTDRRPTLEDKGSASIHSLVVLNAVVTYLQVFLGAGFRHQDMPIWPHIAGAGVVLCVMIWTAAALRRRFNHSRELSFGRILLHSMVGTQILLGVAAYWSRLTTQDAPQPMPVMVAFTVIHTVFGALVFASAIFVALMCYRLVPRRGTVTVVSERQAPI
jgi:cytochrome c oxidase assembly protein subunit 15